MASLKDLNCRQLDTLGPLETRLFPLGTLATFMRLEHMRMVPTSMTIGDYSSMTLKRKELLASMSATRCMYPSPFL